MPVWMFKRFAETDETTMWQWLRTHHVDHVDLDTGPTRQIHPEALTVREWLVRTKGASGSATDGSGGPST